MYACVFDTDVSELVVETQILVGVSCGVGYLSLFMCLVFVLSYIITKNAYFCRNHNFSRPLIKLHGKQKFD